MEVMITVKNFLCVCVVGWCWSHGHAERERMGSRQGSSHEGPARTHVEWGFSSYTWREEQDQKNRTGLKFRC